MLLGRRPQTSLEAEGWLWTPSLTAPRGRVWRLAVIPVAVPGGAGWVESAPHPNYSTEVEKEPKP
jgi:hypothetical protein